ncbi:hypothetical protein HMPREF0819_1506 [Streptococcus equinus ATCC 9812]|uniref:Enterocin A Immunity n=2 Tax=Streptococcus TaxID=1301 RepID=E8JR83_STREI|nr:hypothetical protein HMPREF0819_1506 [Streptococcus equinus ATCC 9812]
MTMMTRKVDEEFLDLLTKVQQLESVQKDKEFYDLISLAADKIQKGANLDIEIMRLGSFINKYLVSNPSQELVDLQLFMQKRANRYKGWLNVTGWFS